jgi:sugar phosphate isomerase/epimerase
MKLLSHALPSLGIAHFTTIEVEPLEFVRMAARIGYAKIGLRMHPAFPGAPFYEIPVNSPLLRAMLSCLADTNISVYDIEFVVVDATFKAAPLAPMLASAATLGARRLSVCGDDADTNRLIDNFSSLCDLAAQHGIGVDLEVMPWRTVGTLGIATAIVRASNRANAGILIDALHVSRSGGDPTDLRALPASMIVSAQLCDAAATRPATTDALIAEARGGRLLPGKGALPLQHLLAELPPHAVLSVEVPNAGLLPELHARNAYHAAMDVLRLGAGSA